MGTRPSGGYHQGWTGKNYHVTGGHEAEAKAEQEAKRPNRFGVWVLRKLGIQGTGPNAATQPLTTALRPTRDNPTPSRNVVPSRTAGGTMAVATCLFC